MCQASIGVKLYKIHIKDTNGLICTPAPSKESDRECPKYRTSQHFRSPFYDEWMGTRDRLRTGLSPLLSVAWHFPWSINNDGE